jgi:hypothetical protein
MQIQNTDLPRETQDGLNLLQSEIDAHSVYADRVRQARDRFKAENQIGNEVFDSVKRALSLMCAGACRCMYCEDSMANEVEHFRPKTFFPEFAFVWMNYLYSCGPCNRVKRSHFRVLIGPTENLDLLRRRNDEVLEPRIGSAVLIDPRTEDPLHYLSLDLVDTFWFVPRHAEGTSQYARADYTITLLKLNHRDYLAKARQEAYATYRARLSEYVNARTTIRASSLAKAIARCGHPAVWAEMKAQSRAIPELAPLFAAASEAYGW